MQRNGMHVPCKEHSHWQVSGLTNTYIYINSMQVEIVENNYRAKFKKLTSVKATHKPMLVVEHLTFSEQFIF